MSSSGNTWAVVLAAGDGTRLASLTTDSAGKAVPKQFCSLTAGRSLKSGHLQLLTKDLRGPNGIVFSPDEKFLYVSNWDPQAKTVTRYPVLTDGSLGRGAVFIDLTRQIAGEEALDGMKADVQGNLYLSARGGVWIFNSQGRHLGTIRAPKPVHNFAWGGDDGRTLYLCARSALYRIDLLVTGIRP